MGKKAARTARSSGHRHDSAIPVVGGREPCPCGSGRRYKACHGRAAATERRAVVMRPFAGFTAECDWVALHQFVPAATAPLMLRGEHAGTQAILATVLPGAAQALRRETGEVLVATQTLATSGDTNRDIADALARALEVEPGTALPTVIPSVEGPRLEELVDASQPLEVTVHEGFGFWLTPDAELSAEDSTALERANAQAIPTVRLNSVTAAYWSRDRDRTQLRWVRSDDEEVLLDALARLHVEGTDTLVDDSRYLGCFRADGLVVPVWDLPPGTEASDVEKPAAELADRLAEAAAATEPLNPEQRRARAGITSRQLTLR